MPKHGRNLLDSPLRGLGGALGDRPAALPAPRLGQDRLGVYARRADAAPKLYPKGTGEVAEERPASESGGVVARKLERRQERLRLSLVGNYLEPGATLPDASTVLTASQRGRED